MKGLPFVLLFTAMTFVSWGSYGPTLHHGATALHHDSLRAFVGVGLAYFLIAVIIPFLILKRSGEVGRWTITGAIYSLVAGAVGAVGALGILLALGYGGLPIYVMPLVFGFAPIVNTLVTAFLSRTFDQIRPIFVIGVITAALGAVGVLTFKPVPGKAAPKVVAAGVPAPATSIAHPVSTTSDAAAASETIAAVQAATADVSTRDTAAGDTAAGDTATAAADTAAGDTATAAAGDTAAGDTAAGDAAAGDAAGDTATTAAAGDTAAGDTATTAAAGDTAAGDTAAGDTAAGDTAAAAGDTAAAAGDTEQSASVSESAATAGAAVPQKKPVQWWGVMISIIVAAGCWGSYGPVLHIGQGKMAGSRLRPFACVGLAYFLIAVAAPLALIYSRSVDLGSWTAVGMGWSFVAGVAGAVGALGVILAFNAGGKPYYVMPLIFGFAPVINTFISVSEAGTWGRVPLMFWVSLAVVIAGAVTVLTNAPRPKPHK